jgi:hypothetical protein
MSDAVNFVLPFPDSDSWPGTYIQPGSDQHWPHPPAPANLPRIDVLDVPDDHLPSYTNPKNPLVPGPGWPGNYLQPVTGGGTASPASGSGSASPARGSGSAKGG